MPGNRVYLQRLDKERKIIANNLRVNQTTDYFYVPESIRKRRVLRYWLEDICGENAPIVVAESVYSRQSVTRKLGPNRSYNANRNLVIALMSYGLIRPQENKKQWNYSSPVDNLSLAQTISWAFGERIQDVLVSQDYFSSARFLAKPPLQRVRELSDAYAGTRFLERFKRKLIKSKSLPKLHIDEDLRLIDIPQILPVGRYRPNETSNTLVMLVNKGLIIPRVGKFHKKSPTNFVDIQALAELISILTERSSDEFLVPLDSYIHDLVESYINRLNGFLSNNPIDPSREYTLQEASDILRIRKRILESKLKKGVFKDVLYSGKNTSIPGIDLAIHILRNNQKRRFRKKDIAELFGVNKIDLSSFRFKPTQKGFYCRQNYVYPLYDKVAKKAKETLGFKPQRVDLPQQTIPTLTFEEIVRKNIEIQREMDLWAKRQQEPIVYT